MILTERCNFNCPYCRGLREDCQGDMPQERVYEVLDQWIGQGLRNVRFSGGEPLLYKGLGEITEYCAWNSVERIAISTNGSFPWHRYQDLIYCGVNDFSVSFDACCAGVCGQMGGCAERMFERVCETIRKLSEKVYTTVGVVLTDDNLHSLSGIVQLAHDLGVADIRIIPAAQEGNMIEGVENIPNGIIEAHPILKYRVENLKAGLPVRSIHGTDSHRCFIPVDDSVVCGDFHFPCVIYMREQGEPIGRIGPNMREERIEWSRRHDSMADPICQKNCLDVCVAHNNRCLHQLGDQG
jgi:molybdenum cofactor biosynthesis enzyme MoaA